MILRLAAKVGGIRVVWKFLPPTYGASLRASPNSHWKDAAFPQLTIFSFGAQVTPQSLAAIPNPSLVHSNLSSTSFIFILLGFTM